MRAGRLEDPASARLVLTSLEAADARTRVLALRAGARRALLTPAHWRRALGDGAPEVRRECLDLLAGASPDEALDEAITLGLEDDDPLVVEAAAFALGERECTGAVLVLVRVAREHEDARCREAAVAALGAIGDDRGRTTVVDALDDKAPVRRRAVVALANFQGADVDAALERAGADRDWQVRASADQLTRDEGAETD